MCIRDRCGEDLRFLVATQLNAVTPSGPVIVLEPAARNTAPAAHVSARDDEDCILVVMPADHVIADAAAFCQAVMTAATTCDAGEVVATFGVKPTRPETGFGYIQRGDAAGDGVFHLARFVEKPELATAEALVADGEHYWNAGIFVVRASVLMRAVAAYAPDIAAAVEKSVAVA